MLASLGQAANYFAVKICKCLVLDSPEESDVHVHMDLDDSGQVAECAVKSTPLGLMSTRGTGDTVAAALPELERLLTPYMRLLEGMTVTLRYTAAPHWLYCVNTGNTNDIDYCRLAEM